MSVCSAFFFFLFFSRRSPPPSVTKSTNVRKVTVADESEVSDLGWSQRPMGTPGLAFVETRSVTLTASGRHEHTRWAQALEEAQGWTEEKEREVGVWTDDWLVRRGGWGIMRPSGRMGDL